MTNRKQPFKEIHAVDSTYPIRIHKGKNYFDFPAHYHKELEVIHVADGQLVVQVNQATHTLSAGDLLFIGSHHIHSYLRTPELNEPTFYILLFDWHYLDDLNKHITQSPYLAPLFLDSHYIYASNLVSFTDAFTDLHKEYTSDHLGRELLIVSQLYFIIAKASQVVGMTTADSVDLKRLQKSHSLIHTVNSLIYNHYMEDLTLEAVAESAGYSIYHFTRLFKKETGFTFKEYLNNFRIHKAVDALKNPALSMTEIALNCGFGSIKSFNRNFKAIHGMSPSDYIKANFVQ